MHMCEMRFSNTFFSLLNLIQTCDSCQFFNDQCTLTCSVASAGSVLTLIVEIMNAVLYILYWKRYRMHALFNGGYHSLGW